MNEVPFTEPRSFKIKQSPEDFVICNVGVWNADGVLEQQDVFVNKGLITEIKPHAPTYLSDVRNIDGKGRTLIPAGVDAQVHLRVPGQFHKETPFTGLYAALRGGYGAVLTMPNTKPVLDSVEALELAKKQVSEAETLTGVKVLYSAAMTKGQLGKEIVDVAALAKSGVTAFTDDGRGVDSDDVMLAGFKSLAATGLPFLQHAEVPGHKGVLAPSKVQAALGVPVYPDSAEYEMVRRDISLLRKTPQTRYHVLHVSARKTVDLVKQAKVEGLKVTAEVSPHHLFFTGDDIDPARTEFKMNPPLRSLEDQKALIASLANGDLDFVATDHAPHEKAAKQTGFNESPFGTTGLETALRVLLSLWSRRLISPQRLVEVFSLRPAQFLNLQDFGRIAPQKTLRAVLVNLNQPPTAISLSELESLSDNNCFISTELPGRIDAVFLGDKMTQ